MTNLDPVQIETSPRPGQMALTDLAGVALLATAVLAMIAGAIQSVTTPAIPTFARGQGGLLPVQLPHLSISVADRLSIFVRSGANVTVALLLVVAVVAAGGSRQLGRALMLVSAILALIVVLANLAAGFEVLRNATGAFSGFGQTNRAAGVLQCLAPIALSVGALGYPRRPSTNQH
jgi:hypothetical protein